MMPELSAVRGFRGLRVLVVGDAMLDRYYVGTASRLSPEGPVPVIKSIEQQYLPGGAANVAANAAALGARTTLLSVVGADHEGQILRSALRKRGVGLSHLVIDPSRPTTAKLRIVADGQLIARYDHETTEDLSGEPEEQLLSSLRSLFWESDVIIISDYLKGVVTPLCVAELSRLNQKHNRLVVVDSKDLSRRRFRNISVITPNHLEAQKASRLGRVAPGCEGTSRELEMIGRSLLSRIGTRWVIMTTGADGALLFQREEGGVLRIAARKVRDASTVGAGDSFTAALALGLASGAPVETAARIAVEAAAIAVGKAHTAVTERYELLERLSMPSNEFADGSTDRLDHSERTETPVGFAGGALDALHAGTGERRQDGVESRSNGKGRAS